MDKLPESIVAQGKKYSKEYKKVVKAIQKYDKIAIFRHIMPDFDALGSQFGLATWIKDNFPKKEVKVFGDNHVTFTPRLFPETDSENEEWFKTPFLGIILDCGNTPRVADPRFKKAKYKIKIDHHPDVEHYGRVSIVDTSMAAASELIVDLISNVSKKNNFVLTKEAARYFYIGMVGDSGRFQYSSTSVHTFDIAGILLKTGINISEIYQNMYQKEIDDLKITAYILNNFHVSPKGVAYYILTEENLVTMHITTERGKENVNVFSNIEGINIWCSITEDLKDDCFRISIRSKGTAVNDVATKWGGGGHAQASGAKINNLDELPAFIKDLDDLL